MKYSPAAFLSYARFDDSHDRGFISKLRDNLSGEVRSRLGETFEIFQDRKSLEWGDNWNERIVEALDEATFLIPIMTPTFFRSKACVEEVIQFISREQKINHKDLILPIYYITVPALENPERPTQEPVLAYLFPRLSSYQFADLRKLRGKPADGATVRKEIGNLAAYIMNRITQFEAAADEPSAGETAIPETPFQKSPVAPNPPIKPERPQPRAGGSVIVLPGEMKPWSDLAQALARMRFEPMEKSFLAVRTSAIRAILAEEFPAYPTEAARVSEIRNSLARTIDFAVALNTSAADADSACELAERLRRHLLGLLSEPR